MKKVIVFLLIVFFVFLTGCSTPGISAEPGSKWLSADRTISLVIIHENYASGTLVVNTATINFDCNFGPGHNEFTAFELRENENDHNPPDILFQGKFYHNAKKGSITLIIENDNISSNENEIVLFIE